MIARAVEVATPVQQTFIGGQGLRQTGFIGSSHPIYQRLHRRISLQHIGENRQQAVFKVAHAPGADLQVEHPQELAVRAGIGDDRLAAFVADDARHRHAVVGVAAQNGIDAGDPAGQLQIHIHAVMRQQHHHLRALGSRLVDGLLHALFLDAKAPVSHHVAGVGNRGVGEGLPNDGAGYAIDFAQHKGFEHRVAEIMGLDVLGDKFNLAGKIFFNNFLHPLHAQGELPVAGHQIYAQQFGGLHHVLPLGPQRGARALPGVAAVEQQGAGSTGFHALDQSGQVGKAANPAIALSRLLKIQMGQRMGGGRTGLHATGSQQVLSDQVRQLPFHAPKAQVDAGLAKMDWLELSVAVGHVQKRDIAKRGQIVECLACAVGVCVGLPAQAHTGHGAGTEHL